MKKILLVFVLLFSSLLLYSCNNIKNMSEKGELNLGTKLTSKYFAKDVFTTGINIDGLNDKYALSLYENKNDIMIKNRFSVTNNTYNYKNDLVIVSDENNLIVDEFKVTKELFLKNYVGIFKYKFNLDNIESHVSEKIEYNYSKGSATYYVLNQTFNFSKNEKLNVYILNNEYKINVKSLSIEIDNNGICSIYFDGFIVLNNKELDTRIFISKVNIKY